MVEKLLRTKQEQYWENRFGLEGKMWSTEPSDSALFASQYFQAVGLKKILIPGFGYGRNAGVFIDNGFDVTGIELSASAVELAKQTGIRCQIYQGSVNSMPFSQEMYDGIFCYALIHLLNRKERKQFLAACFNQLIDQGIMIFIIASKQMELFGTGKRLSKNWFEISPGLKVYFYDNESVEKEFAPFGLISIADIEEPIKYLEKSAPIKLKRVICRK